MTSLFRAIFNIESKHKKLSEEWALSQDPVVEGVTFHCKYLGATHVDNPKSEVCTAEAIKRVIQVAKQTARKPERVSVHVSLDGIRVTDLLTEAVVMSVSIYKISFCSADSHYDHVFAFVATNEMDQCQCHAFLCPKRKIAQDVTISIAQTFNAAYRCWKLDSESQDKDRGTHSAGQSSCHNDMCEISLYPEIEPYSAGSSVGPSSDAESSDVNSSGYYSGSHVLIDLDCSTGKLTDSVQERRNWTLFDDEDIPGCGRESTRAKRPWRCPPPSGASRLGWTEFEPFEDGTRPSPMTETPSTSSNAASMTPSFSIPATSSCHDSKPSVTTPDSPISTYLDSCQSPRLSPRDSGARGVTAFSFDAPPAVSDCPLLCRGGQGHTYSGVQFSFRGRGGPGGSIEELGLHQGGAGIGGCHSLPAVNDIFSGKNTSNILCS